MLLFTNSFVLLKATNRKLIQFLNVKVLLLLFTKLWTFLIELEKKEDNRDHANIFYPLNSIKGIIFWDMQYQTHGSVFQGLNIFTGIF